MPKAMAHVSALARVIADGFATCVPAEHIGVDPKAATGAMWRAELLSRIPLLRRLDAASMRTTFGGIPTRDVVRLLGGFVQSQLPHHPPGDVSTPAWFHTWMHSYAADEDMTHYYGLPSSDVGVDSGARLRKA
jgi:hypothetical protein